MEKKSFQIVMDEAAHELLKVRAKGLGINIGDMIENLLSSLEFRLKRAYGESKINPDGVCLKSDRMMIEVILKADQSGDSDNWKGGRFKLEFTKIRQEILFDVAAAYAFEPKIQLGNKDKD